MGCHTWFYKPTTKTTEQIKEAAISYIKELIEYYSDDSKRDSFNEIYKDDGIYVSEEQYITQRLFYERGLRRIKSDHPYWSVLIYSNQFHNDIVYYVKGIFYESYDLHDVFRIGGYPNDELTSYEETLKFIDTNQIIVRSNVLNRLKEFFEVEPKGGLIVFG